MNTHSKLVLPFFISANLYPFIISSHCLCTKRRVNVSTVAVSAKNTKLTIFKKSIIEIPRIK